jgi:hypothetical protein
MLVALAAGHGIQWLAGQWRTRVMRLAAAVVVVAGGVLIWQSATGSFGEFVDTQRRLQRRIEASGPACSRSVPGQETVDCRALRDG